MFNKKNASFLTRSRRSSGEGPKDGANGHGATARCRRHEALAQTEIVEDLALWNGRARCAGGWSFSCPPTGILISWRAHAVALREKRHGRRPGHERGTERREVPRRDSI